MIGSGKAVEARPFASLSSGLLARKGQAKPAMRPQGYGGFGHMTMGHEDLGWNDMGYDVHEDASAPPPAAQPAPQLVTPDQVQDALLPPVLAQRQALADEIEADVEAPDSAQDDAPDDVSGASILSIKPRQRPPVAAAAVVEPAPEPAPPPPAAASRPQGRKAAFTLRLDAERHLKLRLACAVGNRSAQQVVTDALDRLLASLPDVGELADKVPGRTRP